MLRYANNLSEYETAMQEGIIDENTFVIVLDEKVAKFKGQTFDWSGSGVSDLSDYATKEEVQTAVSDLTSVIIGNERIHAAALNDLNSRIVYLESIISTLNNN